MSMKFLVLGGGILGLGGGPPRGGECRFYFYGRADFSGSRVVQNLVVQLRNPPIQRYRV